MVENQRQRLEWQNHAALTGIADNAAAHAALRVDAAPSRVGAAEAGLEAAAACGLPSGIVSVVAV